ncbi:response regulator [Candidatus Saccharibacteria bacterium]|nr:response regulator [Candidatus Saccharibacteria bacterium]
MAKVLLVEDDKALREIYGVRLLAEGYDIVSAGDGEEAIDVAIREKPDLIISDVMMPKISGFEMLDLLRSNEATKDIKVIMMTALSGDQHRERSESLGADRYLVKSQVGIEDVVNTVHEILGDRAEAGQTATAVPQVMPAPNQSPINPPSATEPSTVAGVPAPAMPSTPPNVPVITTPPPITPIQDTPTVPTPPVSLPDLAPVAPPSTAPPEAPAPAAPPDVPAPAAPPPPPPAADEVPSFQPKELSAGYDDDQETPYQPAVDLAQSGAHIGTRVIQPTGEAVNAKVDVENLIANEDAKAILAQSVSPDFQSQLTPAPAEAVETVEVPEIQIDPTGAITVDSLPDTPAPDPSVTFPNQS